MTINETTATPPDQPTHHSQVDSATESQINTDAETVQQQIDDQIASRKNYKIYDYISSYKGAKWHSPKRINFTTELDIRLHPKYKFEFGELQEVTYYAEQTLNPDGITFTYSIPVVREHFEYTRDEAGFPVSRIQTICWFYEDGTEDTENIKTRRKIYADKSVDTLSELVRRRDNNIKNIIGQLIIFISVTRPGMSKLDIITDGKEFFSTHNDERVSYIYEGTTDLEEVVRDTSMFAWMADDISGFTPYTTIRNFIIHELSMGQRSM